MRGLLLAAVALAAGAPWGAAAASADPSARLSADATALVERLVGVGRGRVLVTVETRRMETRSESELAGPVPGSPKSTGMPGYARAKSGDAATVISRQISVVADDAQVTRIRAYAVLDAGVSAANAELVKTLLARFLQLDPARGDELTLAQADMHAGWAASLEGPEGARAGLLAGAGLACALLLALAAYLIALRSVRALSRALERPAASLQPPPAVPAAPPFGALPAAADDWRDDGLPALTERPGGGA